MPTSFLPTRDLVALTALLGGSVLFNVFKEDVPTNRNSSFGWFTTGLVLYAVLLTIITTIQQ